MAAADRKKTACVTGGNGYIASALIKMLLEKGYLVRTTVRNPDDKEKNSHLEDLKKLGSLEVYRSDLDNEGSFDEAIAGCDYAFLLAAPVNYTAPDPEGYVVSKVLSEKEAIRFAQENSISLVIVCPVLTVGASPVSKVYTSVPASLSMLSGDEAALGMLKGIEKSSGAMPMVDLDDLCRAEVFLAETETASGRYICCSFNTTVVEIARSLADMYPQYNVNTDRLDKLLEKRRVCLSSGKLLREGFEFKYNTLDEIYENVIEYGKALVS